MVRDLLGLLWSFSMIQASEITRESSSGIPGTYYKQWTWSVWYDTFFGHEQTETYDAIVKKGWKICPNKEDLAASECRIKDTGETISDGYFFNTSALLGTNLECKLNGIECHHSRCMNFEVRFLCEELMVESGSAVFYFTLLAVPVTLILFRLYCWDKIKKRYLKRLRNRPLTRTNVNDTTDNSRFDPPSYEELFGPLTTPSYNEVHASPIEMSINQTDAGCSGWSHTSADNNMCLNIRDSLSPSACTRNKIQMREFRSDDGAAHVHQFYAIRGHINSCYVSDDVQGRGARNFSGENTSISVITSDINDVPPPSYAEALVILKRTEGLDATHL